MLRAVDPRHAEIPHPPKGHDGQFAKELNEGAQGEPGKEGGACLILYTGACEQLEGLYLKRHGVTPAHLLTLAVGSLDIHCAVVEEAQAEMETLTQRLGHLWTSVKSDEDQYGPHYLLYIKKAAMLGACELIQVAAMAEKALLGYEIKKEEHGNEKPAEINDKG